MYRNKKLYNVQAEEIPNYQHRAVVLVSEFPMARVKAHS